MIEYLNMSVTALRKTPLLQGLPHTYWNNFPFLKTIKSFQYIWRTLELLSLWVLYFFSKFLSLYFGKCFILLGMCGTFCSLCLVYRNAEDLNKSGILCCLASMFVPCIPLMLLRGEAREKYGIEVRICIIFMWMYFFHTIHPSNLEV